MTLAIDPNGSSSNDLNLKSNVDEITVAFWGQLVESDSRNHQVVVPVFTARVLDSKGNILKSFNNITSAGDGDRITIEDGRDVKIELYNNRPQTTTVEVRVTDVSKVPNHPNEGFGQWLTVVSLPIFGLGLWFMITGYRGIEKEGVQHV